MENLTQPTQKNIYDFVTQWPATVYKNKERKNRARVSRSGIKKRKKKM